MGEELEILNTVQALVKHLAPLAEKNPEASVRGDDFNALLKRARAALPSSGAIRDLKEVENVTNLVDLFGKLSIIEGAVQAFFTARSHAAIRPHNQKIGREY